MPGKLSYGHRLRARGLAALQRFECRGRRQRGPRDHFLLQHAASIWAEAGKRMCGGGSGAGVLIVQTADKLRQGVGNPEFGGDPNGRGTHGFHRIIERVENFRFELRQSRHERQNE
jgi:hypothetical protein